MKRRIFKVGEANALLPHLTEVLGRIQDLREVVEERNDQLKILDVIWGKAVAEPENPDHAEYRKHRRAIGRAVKEIERLIREDILEVGVRFPQGGLEHGLLDFPTRLDGRWVFLCWQVGEPEIQAWHEVEGGLAGRKPMTPELARRMGQSGSEELPRGPGHAS